MVILLYNMIDNRCSLIEVMPMFANQTFDLLSGSGYSSPFAHWFCYEVAAISMP